MNRKKITFLLFIPFLGFGQNLELGGEIGINFARFEYHGRTSESNARFNIFIASDYIATENFSLGVKLGYAAKGAGDIFIPRQSFDAKFDYLSFIILPKIYFLKSQSFQPFFNIGPTLSYLLNAEINGAKVEDAKDFDYGIQIGVGSKIELNNSLILELNLVVEQGFNRMITISNEQLNNRAIPYAAVGIRKAFD